MIAQRGISGSNFDKLPRVLFHRGPNDWPTLTHNLTDLEINLLKFFGYDRSSEFNFFGDERNNRNQFGGKVGKAGDDLGRDEGFA